MTLAPYSSTFKSCTEFLHHALFFSCDLCFSVFCTIIPYTFHSIITTVNTGKTIWA